jgi:hypothetical protein
MKSNPKKKKKKKAEKVKVKDLNKEQQDKLINLQKHMATASSKLSQQLLET